jgi:lactoylglutathione lyase
MKFDHVHLKCRDLEKSLKYYQEMFQATIINQSLTGPAPMIRLALGGTILILTGMGKGEDLPEPGARQSLYPAAGLVHFGVVVPDLEKTVREMKAKGAKFFVEPREAFPGTRVAFVEAPDGDVIEIVQRDTPINP